MTELRKRLRELGIEDHAAVGMILILFIVTTPLALAGFLLMETPGILYVLFLASDIALIAVTAYLYWRLKSQSDT